MSEPSKFELQYIDFDHPGGIPNCSDPGCEADASVFITENGERKPWCTGHAHVNVAMWMVGL